ncbi:hypothetical protein Hanom_Chr13g01197121 [Helianthus anomalus]
MYTYNPIQLIGLKKIQKEFKKPRVCKYKYQFKEIHSNPINPKNSLFITNC